MTTTTTSPFTLLTEQQIDTFVRDGLLVVDNFLGRDQVAAAEQGLAATLAKHGVDVPDLEGTAGNLAALSSTGGSGGVLDVFYDEWKLDDSIALNPQLLAWTQQLWKAAYCYGEEALADLSPDEQFKWHPFGSFDPNHGGYAYIDRICYRIPTALSDKIGRQQEQEQPSSSSSFCNASSSAKTQKNKKKKTLQRSLTPHLDCCPDTFTTAVGKSKWRPIQCFVSLTDNLEPNTGGFEAAKGFHREFQTWTRQRAPTIVIDQHTGQTKSIPAPCIGEYTHIRPTQDAKVMQRVQHVPVKKAAAVFWDHRLPHANAYRHTGTTPRVIVYASFLPNLPLNRAYAERQLQEWWRGRAPTDQWINTDHDHNDTTGEDQRTADQEEASAKLQTRFEKLPKLSRQLLALEEW